MSPTRRSVLHALVGSTVAASGCSAIGSTASEDRSETPSSSSETATAASESTTSPDSTGTDGSTPTETDRPTPTETPEYVPPGGSRPAMFVHLDTLAAVRGRVEAGEEPWTSAHEAFIADVKDAMAADPESVVGTGGDHTFSTAGPDQPDQRNEYKAAIRVGDRIRDLGLAYQLHGDDAYARKAVDMLHAWFLDADTYMEPVLSHSIELYITLPKMWWGAELVRGHDAWARKSVGSEGDLREWVTALLDDMDHTVGTAMGQQNIFNWQEMTHAAGAVYLRDWGRLRTATERNRTMGFDQLREDGLLENELGRSTSLTYSVYAIKALTTAAEISRLYTGRLDGPPLYEYTKFDDETPAMRRMYDAHVPYILDPAAWRERGAGNTDRFQTAYGFPARSMEKAGSLYEVAYSQYGVDEYLDVVTAGGRPVENQPTYVQAQQAPIEDEGRPRRDERILGWTTLTHAERERLTAE